MDRPIDSSFLRRQRVRHLIRGFLVMTVLVGAFFWLIGWISPSVKRREIRSARVELGRVEATITASGTVAPVFERVMTSPIASRVLSILKRPGEPVSVGDAILALDLSTGRLALGKLDEELALKANQREKLEISLAQDLNDLDSQLRIKRLDTRYLEGEYARSLKMAEKGLISRDDVRLSELALEKARVEVQRLDRSIGHKRESMQASLSGLALEIKMLKTQHEEMRRQLSLAGMQADRDGVLTWTVPDEGASVVAGEVVARIADLSAFRVEGKVSEVHARRIFVDMPVKVRVGEAFLMGRISNIIPTLEDGIVTFLVALDEPAHPALRSNLRVDVYPVLHIREDVLRVARGPFVNGGEGIHDVFVIRGDEAVKTMVEIGLSGVDFFEVVVGLDKGDEVIISNMRDYLHMKKVAVR